VRCRDQANYSKKTPRENLTLILKRYATFFTSIPQVHDSHTHTRRKIEKTINPLTEKPVTTWYKPGQTAGSVLGTVSSSFEECRAESVALYRTLYKLSLLSLFPNADRLVKSRRPSRDIRNLRGPNVPSPFTKKVDPDERLWIFFSLR
jgi:hypothetical protein